MLSGARILLTGATGLIGGEVARALATAGAEEVWALVRSRPGTTPAARLAERWMRSNAPVPPAVHPVEGDLGQEELALAGQDQRLLRDRIDVVVHCAAETSFARPDENRRINVEGLARLLAFVRTCRSEPLVVHFGTAAGVGAAHGRIVREDEPQSPEAEHHNEYTRSKAAAETLLRESGLPSLVLRPSIVLSAGLPDSAFACSILWCLALMNELEAVPIAPEACIDLIPVGFCAEAAVRLLKLPARSGDCYHLAAGERAVTAGRIAAFLDRHYHRTRPLLLIPPEDWSECEERHYLRSRIDRRIFARLRHYLPFLNMDVTYDNSRLRQDLGVQLPDLPAPESYLGDLLRLIPSTAALRESWSP